MNTNLLHEWAGPVDEVIETTLRAAGSAGATDPEAGWEILDRTLLAPEPQPLATDRVAWFFEARKPHPLGGTIKVGSRVAVEAGSRPADHMRAVDRAGREFLRQHFGIRVREIADFALRAGS